MRCSAISYIIAEAVSREPIATSTGKQLYHARVLCPTSPKHIAFKEMIDKSSLSHFIKVGQCLSHYLKRDQPVVFVTGWDEHTELLGLILETDGEIADYPGLAFAAFYTNWDDLDLTGVTNLFAHEFSHVWMHWLGMDMSLSISNKFHTSTSITDFYMAFSEGFAECLEIITKDLTGYKVKDGELWDYAFDGNALISQRDGQLRYHAVKNNRFIYHTAIPHAEDFSTTYANLHMAHITSTAFTPEKIKNGSQILSSEGAIASVFFQIYAHEVFKNKYVEENFYTAFGTTSQETAPIVNLLLKILYALSKIDLRKPSLMTDFVRSYGVCFPAEKAELYNIFTRATHFATVSAKARELFGEIYRVGRRGATAEAVDMIQNIRNPMVVDLRAKLLDGELELDAAVYCELWITGDNKIPPTPWEPDTTVPYRFNINTATAIDFMAINGVTLEIGEKLVDIREEQGGFMSTDEFWGYCSNFEGEVRDDKRHSQLEE
ncbi:MAG: hypothetical protein FWC92_08675 [Defluviitaleaceae bacterium]|nr:hypothetical protein [Defluviitaleaceae bacterium]